MGTILKVLSVTAICMVSCTNQGIKKFDTPKAWHHEPQQRELWDLEEITFDRYQLVKIGDPIRSIKGGERKEGMVCYICWLTQRSYQVCIKVANGLVADKSIREVKLTYRHQ